MLGRFKRASIAATLLATLLVPAVTSLAGPEQELDAVRDRLDELRAKIKSETAEAGSLREKIDVVNRQITEVQIEINRLDRRVAELEVEVAEARARIAATQKEIDAIEARATAQAVMLYKSGPTESLDALLDSSSLTELEKRAQLLGVAAEQNTGELVRFSRLRVQIQHEKADLFEKKSALESVLDSREDYLSEREKLKSQLRKHLTAVQGNLAEHRDKEKGLEKAAARITQQIIARQAPSVANLGVSASGFIWPLNGGVTSGYGPRWGRMHTGIDIDGVSGQAIVASKGGRVILAQPYSGYGNTVIIDHGGGIATLYAHMSSFSVSNGQTVGQGRQVGAVGCTGSCTGDHLHFEVRINGKPVDPMAYLP